MKTALTAYRVMATIVGVLLIVRVLVGLPLNELHRVNPAWFTEGTRPQQVGAAISTYLGIAHGYLYIIFLGTAFFLSRRAAWTMPFTLVTLVCGTIPILSFWSERRATRRVREQHPELAAAST